jgi:predicted CoA-binding protein
MYVTIQQPADLPRARNEGIVVVAPNDDREWLAFLIAVQEGRSPVPLLDDAGIRALLRSRPRIAIVGASANPSRPSNGVMASLRRAGYDVVPVNPGETEIDGLRCFPTVADAVRETGPVGIVDVFRRADQCVAPAREAVAVGATCLWLQLGIANAEAGRIAHEAGLSVVMDRCTIIEHRRLTIG